MCKKLILPNFATEGIVGVALGGMDEELGAKEEFAGGGGRLGQVVEGVVHVA